MGEGDITGCKIGDAGDASAHDVGGGVCEEVEEEVDGVEAEEGVEVDGVVSEVGEVGRNLRPGVAGLVAWEGLELVDKPLEVRKPTLQAAPALEVFCVLKHG